jgi:iron complex outermembrane receptor protein
VACLAGWVAIGLCAPAYADDKVAQYLSSLSIEELGNISITSVSRRAEKLSEAPAAIYVITNEDIRRAGVLTLPEALRLAPNLEVARVNANQYAISARGFNNGIGNKLLVLIDGRTVYTPLFSTVNWDSQFVLLEDVERIEVISGPGATLWGANAVNGVINVITRSARDSQGELASAGVGQKEAALALRHGGTFGEDGHFRIYGQRLNQDSTWLANGNRGSDGGQTTQAGFRADWGGHSRGFTVQGDSYRSDLNPGPLGPPTVSGTNLLARWNEQVSEQSSFELQAYYDHTKRDDPFTYGDRTSILDLQFQHAVQWGSGTHKLLWGGGYRGAQDSTQTHFNSLNRLPQTFVPADRTLHWANLFVQDEVALTAAFSATLGLKAERNDYTGVEYLPSARFAWKLDKDQLLWGALSRAVRAPARLDRDFFLYAQLPGRPLLPVIKGGPDFQSEVADVLDLGYRAQPSSSFSYSVTGFFSRYDKLRSGQPPPAFIQNLMDGTTHGLEAWGTYQLNPDWRLSAGLTELRENLHIKPGSLDPTGPKAQGNDPAHTWQLRSAWNLGERWQLDATLRHVGALPNPVVPDYTTLDMRINWRLRPNLDLALTAQNLLGPEHVEFGDQAATRSSFERNLFLKLTWRQ